MIYYVTTCFYLNLHGINSCSCSSSNQHALAFRVCFVLTTLLFFLQFCILYPRADEALSLWPEISRILHSWVLPCRLPFCFILFLTCPPHTHTPMLFQAWPLMTRDCWLILACAKLCSRLVMWTGVEGLEWAHWTHFTCCLRYSPAWAGNVGASASRAERVSRLNTTASSSPQQAGDGGGWGLAYHGSWPWLGHSGSSGVSLCPLFFLSSTVAPFPLSLNFPSENVRMVEQWSGQKWNFVNKQPPQETLEHRLCWNCLE